jgi:glyoxalase family protein
VASSIISGLHHVTAICGDAQKNVDFYTGTLGLRLVKLSVKDDDASAYHLYYGDAVGSPGSLISFYSHARGPQGARGVGMFTSVTFAIPVGSTEFWRARLADFRVENHHNCHGEQVLAAEDPDGLKIHLVERPRTASNPWSSVGIDVSSAILGLDSVVLGTRIPATKQFVYEALGLPLRLESVMQSGNHLSRYEAADHLVDVMPTEHRSFVGRGTIHHVAFSVGEEAMLNDWHVRFGERKTPVSEIRDQIYYKAIYFREPGGALIAIASRKPGVTVDETRDRLGTTLLVPPTLADRVNDIQRLLPDLRLPVSLL